MSQHFGQEKPQTCQRPANSALRTIDFVQISTALINLEAVTHAINSAPKLTTNKVDQLRCRINWPLTKTQPEI
jgi:hypothetical protein